MSWLTTAPHSSHWHPVPLLEHIAKCSLLTPEPAHPKVRSTSQSASTSGTASKSHGTSPIPTGLVFLLSTPPPYLSFCHMLTKAALKGSWLQGNLSRERNQSWPEQSVVWFSAVSENTIASRISMTWEVPNQQTHWVMSVSISTWACFWASFQASGTPASPLFRSVPFLH